MPGDIACGVVADEDALRDAAGVSNVTGCEEGATLSRNGEYPSSPLPSTLMAKILDRKSVV